MESSDICRGVDDVTVREGSTGQEEELLESAAELAGLGYFPHRDAPEQSVVSQRIRYR